MQPAFFLLLVTAAPPTIKDAWEAIPALSSQGCGDDLVFDYWPDGGIRNFYCRMITVFSWKRFLELAPRKPFTSGPHKDRLDLQNKHEFERYDPEFVRWLNRTLIPAQSDPKFRAATQPAYDKFVRGLARTYYAVYAKMKTRPDWLDDQCGKYMEAAKAGEASESFWGLSSFMGKTGFEKEPKDEDWGGYDPNLQRIAALFWMRRTIDHSAPAFMEGLTTLLRTYDSGWLNQKSKTN